jgi:hypothetical protein
LSKKIILFLSVLLIALTWLYFQYVSYLNTWWYGNAKFGHYRIAKAYLDRIPEWSMGDKEKVMALATIYEHGLHWCFSNSDKKRLIQLLDEMKTFNKSEAARIQTELHESIQNLLKKPMNEKSDLEDYENRNLDRSIIYDFFRYFIF